MKDGLTLLFLLALIGSETALWITNPMHIPTAFVTARALGLQLFSEPGDSMAPTVRSGEHVLVSSWPYWKSPPKVGDVVAFVDPLDPSVADLKRIVAGGGSTVEIRGGVTYVDARPQALPPNAQESATATEPDISRWRVPAGSYFVLGDNRDQSVDSRTYGFIARTRIIGKMWSW
ncbi:MAG TPA: signal peptidase I [Steroidobacteraceae bacterium]|nr:signal peptidase I [Steroidobacteraceae bacterium]